LLLGTVYERFVEFLIMRLFAAVVYQVPFSGTYVYIVSYRKSVTEKLYFCTVSVY